jgi:hypothetical protein
MACSFWRCRLTQRAEATLLHRARVDALPKHLEGAAKATALELTAKAQEADVLRVMKSHRMKLLSLLDAFLASHHSI